MNKSADFSKIDPLPVGYYFDPKYHRFREAMNRGGAHYVGHTSMVPNPGDYYVMEQYKGAYVLVHGSDGKYRLISNVCRHRQARMLPNDRLGVSGNLRGGVIACPVHFWSYDTCGKHVRAPEFSDDVRVDLPTKELRVVDGMLFDSDDDIGAEIDALRSSGVFAPELLNMNDYSFIPNGRDIVHYNFSVEKFMEVYQDVRHVVPFHPTTFAAFVDCATLAWGFAKNSSVQVVAYNEGRRAGEHYSEAHKLVNKLYHGNKPPHGALWVAMYPGLMIEWYPHVLVVSMLIYTGIDKCVNVVDYFVHKDFFAHRNEILTTARPAYDDSAKEDGVICDREQQGLRILWEDGDHFSGPFHPYEELGVGHYFDYVRRQYKSYENPSGMLPRKIEDAYRDSALV